MTDPGRMVFCSDPLPVSIAARLLEQWSSAMQFDPESEPLGLVEVCRRTSVCIVSPFEWDNAWNVLLTDPQSDLAGRIASGRFPRLIQTSDALSDWFASLLGAERFTLIVWGGEGDEASARSVPTYLSPDEPYDMAHGCVRGRDFAYVLRNVSVRSMDDILGCSYGMFLLGVILVPAEKNPGQHLDLDLQLSTRGSMIEVALDLVRTGTPVYALVTVFDNEGQLLLRISDAGC